MLLASWFATVATPAKPSSAVEPLVVVVVVLVVAGAELLLEPPPPPSLRQPDKLRTASKQINKEFVFVLTEL
jgi:hypothetical protein